MEYTQIFYYFRLMKEYLLIHVSKHKRLNKQAKFTFVTRTFSTQTRTTKKKNDKTIAATQSGQRCSGEIGLFEWNQPWTAISEKYSMGGFLHRFSS